MQRHYILVLSFLLTACDGYDPNNPLPSGRTIDRATTLGQITMLSDIVKVAPETAVCRLRPYASEVSYRENTPLSPDVAEMNSFLKEGHDHDMAADGLSGLIIATPNGVKMRTYTRWTIDMNGSSSTSPVPAGFTERDCTRMADAALFRTKDKHNNTDVLVFGSYSP